MPDGVKITLTGQKEWAAKMRQFGKVGEEEVKKANLATGFQILTEWRLNLRNQKVVDTGGTISSTHLENRSEGASTQMWDKPGVAWSGEHRINAPIYHDGDVLVGSAAWGAIIAEFGRAAGSKMPPPDALKPWLRRHGLPEGLAYVVARNIAERGIAPRPSLVPAVEVNRDNHQRNQTRALQRAAERVSK